MGTPVPREFEREIQATEMCIELAEAMWATEHRFPEKWEFQEGLHRKWGEDFAKVTTPQILSSTYFQRAIMERGINPTGMDGAPGLLPQQIAAVQLILNNMDRRTPWNKLQDMGVTKLQWQGWMQNDTFKRYYESQAAKLFLNGLPTAHEALMRQVSAGSVPAIKLFYDKFGFGADMQQGQQQDVNVVLGRLIEVIQRNVSDPKVLEAIARDFRAVTNQQGALGAGN